MDTREEKNIVIYWNYRILRNLNSRRSSIDASTYQRSTEQDLQSNRCECESQERKTVCRYVNLNVESFQGVHKSYELKSVVMKGINSIRILNITYSLICVES